MHQPRHQLIQARKSRRLSQAEVAEGAKIDRKTLSHLEQGRSNPREETIGLLCDYYQTSKEDLDLHIVVPTGESVQHVTTPALPASHQHSELYSDSLLSLIHRYGMTKRSYRWYNQGEQSGFSLVPYLGQRSYLHTRSNPVAPVNRTFELSLLMNPRRYALYQLLSGACTIFTLSPYALLSQESHERLLLAQIHSSYLDNEALDDLSRTTTRYWKLYQTAPLDALLEMVAGHFSGIVQFLKNPHPTTIYNRLCSLASENALLLGRIFHNINEYDLANDYYLFAVKVALDIRHTDLCATSMGRIALLDLHRGKPYDALLLLQETQRMTIHDVKLGAWLCAIEANTYAEIGRTDDLSLYHWVLQILQNNAS